MWSRIAMSRRCETKLTGSVTEIFILGSPSINLRPAPSRAPPLPIPPIVLYQLVYAKVVIIFEIVVCIQIKNICYTTYNARAYKRPALYYGQKEAVGMSFSSRSASAGRASVTRSRRSIVRYCSFASTPRGLSSSTASFASSIELIAQSSASI